MTSSLMFSILSKITSKLHNLSVHTGTFDSGLARIFADMTSYSGVTWKHNYMIKAEKVLPVSLEQWL